MPALPPTARDTFLTHLRRSGLVSAEQLAAVTPRLPAGPRGKLVARALVEEGLLTRFQAEHLLAGRSSGFFLKRYRILEELGHGGMGRVFKAEDRDLKRTVALKILSPGVVGSERAQALFFREMQAASRLNHPNVVTAFDADEANGRHFLVLEYVNGPNLEQLVRQKGPLPVGQACDFVRQAALGLGAAHRLGMVHRDVKPANLLLHRTGEGSDWYGVVKIIDFGLARLAGTGPADGNADTILTTPNTILGTPDFLSPEQARDLHKTDVRSDLYSLGCTLYFLLAGRVPFPGGGLLEKLVRHSTEEPAPLNGRRPDVPPGVVAVVRRLMAKRPEDRFRTPRELADALAPFADGRPAPRVGRSAVRAWVEQTATMGVDDRVGKTDPLPTPDAGRWGASALLDTLAPEDSPTPVALVGIPPSLPAPPRGDLGGRDGRPPTDWAAAIRGGLEALLKRLTGLGRR
jgi:serine/threonine-protein kinase